MRPPEPAARPDIGPAVRAALAILILALLPGRPPAAAGPGAGQRAEDPKPARRLDPPPAAADAERLGSGEQAVLRDPRTLVLEVRVAPKDTYALLGQRYILDLRELPKVRALNGESLPAPGGIVAIPYASLNDQYKMKVLRDLFPADAPRDGDWVHKVGAGRLAAPEESLWQVALWFTGRGENFEALADRNELPGLATIGGQEIVIPGDLLLPPFAELARSAADPPAAPEEEGAPQAGSPEEPADDFTEAPGEEETEPGPTGPGGAPSVPAAEGAEDLAYGRDSEGRYAVYRLKRGEALYSAVVVRYTGRLDAQEVNDLAVAIARRSGIRDVTDIPIGFKVRIPQEHLLPEYLPPDDPRRLAWQRSQSDVARYTNRAHTDNLRGVAVILDAGHGGRDQGTSHNGVWEHDYVYDIMCRIKALLEQGTGARVLTTIKDRREGYAIHDTSRLKRSQAEVLLTDPPFALQHRAASVNLRWYLSNSYYRRLVAEGYDPLKVVFTSLHADARHPSVGGAMVYVPGEEFRRGRYGHSGAVYARHREAREKPFVSFTREERARSEGLSRQFARTLIAAFAERRVAVHSYQPVRERIIRRGRSWVPAVLRCNQVPVEALIEVANLNNSGDSQMIADPAYRQRVAEAYVQALQTYYGGRTPPPRPASSRGR